MRIRVGKASQVLRAPTATAAWAKAAGFSVLRSARNVHLDADGTVANADAQAVVYRWTMRRYGAGPCARARTAADVTGDGCVDVADVQAVAGAYTDRSRRRARPAPLLDPVHAPSFGAAPALAALLPANVTFTVNSTADDADANTADGICRTAGQRLHPARRHRVGRRAFTGPDGIAFNIPGTGVQTIHLLSALPDLSDASGGTEIDGYTQPGASPNTDPIASNAVLRIAITGGGDDVEYQAIRITSPNNTIRGLAIYSVWRKIWIAGPNAATRSSRATSSAPTPPRPTRASFVASEDGAS